MNQATILGTRDNYGKHEPFYLTARDRLQHIHIIGQTGTGKSNLLLNLIVQDIWAGRGIAVIDLHGALAQDVMARIPPERFKDVVYFDASDHENPIGFNLLAPCPPERRHLVVSGIVSVFKACWPEFFGPRMENILNHALAALMECENVSLLSLPRMLTDDSYRQWVVNQVKDPFVRAFWEREFAAIDRRTRAEYVAPILNKVGALLLSPQMRNVLGQVRSRIDARYMMDNRKIFIANLSKGLIGDDKANLLGSLWVTQFHLAAMSRADVPAESREEFFIHVDEWASITSESFAHALAECRKYKIGLTLANQHFAQIKESIRGALFGNVGTTVAFRVGHEDASILEKAFGRSYAADSFTGLGNGEVYSKIIFDGRAKEPFFGKTYDPVPPEHDRVTSMIKRSREQYATRKEIVEQKLVKWLRGHGATTTMTNGVPANLRVQSKRVTRRIAQGQGQGVSRGQTS